MGGEVFSIFFGLGAGDSGAKVWRRSLLFRYSYVPKACKVVFEKRIGRVCWLVLKGLNKMAWIVVLDNSMWIMWTNGGLGLCLNRSWLMMMGSDGSGLAGLT